MKISILGIEETYQRSFQHIIQLFLEDPEVVFQTDENANLLVSYPIMSDKQVHILLENVENHQRLEKTVSSVTRIIAEEDKKKHLKRMMSQALLLVLQDFTGIEQPWGILTGIRPTKLLHRQLREGKDLPQSQQKIKEEYLVRNEKIELMQDIVKSQLTAVPDLYQLSKEVSIYIGIPFCPTKCAYCTFPAYAIQGKQGSVQSFLGGLHYEMEMIGNWLKEQGIGITTVYFGGGTPTSITAEEMDLLYEKMYQVFPRMDKVREVTVEAGRPDTITEEKLKVLKKWKIDRISINPQSYIQETLNAIGRHHTVEETVEKFILSREMGMKNINMDLIIGLPGEGIKEFHHSLQETAQLMPESLTVHTLSFKRASEMTRNKEKYKVADRFEVMEMMKLAEQWTIEKGYSPYYLYRQKNILGNLENVGYALPGKESIYNIMIMEEMQTIIGLGCGAASKWVDPVTGEISRFANPKEPKAYNENYEHYTKEKIKALNRLFGKMLIK
ncbi:coproporphyrinogen III oxidase [Ammoniphilus resinae]|uniref:Oxygen-independent coproporphyrinogen-3 oxidase n=1 Tax=Ammoniphilus resinae TaxID=861532 RepID=A0ABS4GJK8_9BACL|nr:coproporphyrinogen III oxidase [Ammoniphilus resinae]MBP1930453.1 oxygen-independent coproporphyrinogen-3 oxidase [Ammoniphilus resinae]